MSRAAPIDPPAWAQAVWRGEVVSGYRVTSAGEVLSAWRRAGGGVIRWELGEEYAPIKAAPCGNERSYRGVSLRSNGRTIRASVHRLVAESFLGPCPEGMEVCHGDGDGANNAVANLRYDTPSANARDKDRHGTGQRGDRNNAAVLSDREVRQIREMRRAGGKLREIAERFGVRESTVSRIANGVRRAQ